MIRKFYAQKVLVFLFMGFFTSILLFSGTIQVTYPNGGESFNCGDTITIQWTSTGCSDKVIVVLEDMPKTYLIDPKFDNKEGFNSCTWTIPHTVPSGSNYKIRVTDKNDLNTVDSSNGNLSIQCANPCEITLNYPNGGEIFNCGDEITLKWTSSGDCNNKVNIVLRKSSEGSTSAWTGMYNVDNHTGLNTHKIKLPDYFYSAQPDYKFRVFDKITGISDEGDGLFSIQCPNPCGITVKYPNGGETFNSGGDVTIKWTSSGNCSDKVIIMLCKKEECKGYGALSSGHVTNNQGLNSYTWTIPEKIFSKKPEYKFMIINGTGGAVDKSDDFFSIIKPLFIKKPKVLYYPKWKYIIPQLKPDARYKIGRTYEIKWNTSRMNINTPLNVELWNASKKKRIYRIGKFSGGVLSWTVPARIRPGRYAMRFSTPDGRALRFSEVFRIVK